MRAALVPWPHTVALDHATTTVLHPGRVEIRADDRLRDVRAWLEGEFARLAAVPSAGDPLPSRVVLLIGEAPADVPPADGIAPEQLPRTSGTP
ncbi:hypothetical protein ACNF49_34985 [Actinomadura sp. ATCC 39365]